LGTLHRETYERIFKSAGFEIIQSDNMTLSVGDVSESHNFFALTKRANVSLPELPEE